MIDFAAFWLEVCVVVFYQACVAVMSEPIREMTAWMEAQIADANVDHIVGVDFGSKPPWSTP
jgi:hypothetical protein